MKTYKWNDVVKHVVTPITANVAGITTEWNEHEVTLACGAKAAESSVNLAAMTAEILWSEDKKNAFVIRSGTPRHIELTELTRDEVIERVPDATV